MSLMRLEACWSLMPPIKLIVFSFVSSRAEEPTPHKRIFGGARTRVRINRQIPSTYIHLRVVPSPHADDSEARTPHLSYRSGLARSSTPLGSQRSAHMPVRQPAWDRVRTRT